MLLETILLGIVGWSCSSVLPTSCDHQKYFFVLYGHTKHQYLKAFLVTFSCGLKQTEGKCGHAKLSKCFPINLFARDIIWSTIWKTIWRSKKFVRTRLQSFLFHRYAKVLRSVLLFVPSVSWTPNATNHGMRSNSGRILLANCSAGLPFYQQCLLSRLDGSAFPPEVMQIKHFASFCLTNFQVFLKLLTTTSWNHWIPLLCIYTIATLSFQLVNSSSFGCSHSGVATADVFQTSAQNIWQYLLRRMSFLTQPTDSRET